MTQETENKRRGRANKMGVDEKVVVRNKKIKTIIITTIILIVLLLTAKFIFKQIIEPAVDGKKPLSILLIGTDGAAMRDDLWGDQKAELTDSIMVVTFNPDLYKFEVTSIPRDTSIDYTTDVCQNAGAPEWQDQINELYYVSGNSIDCLESAVSNTLQVPIDYYVKVNMDQLVEIIDTLGGIEIVAHAADGSISEPSLDQTEYYTWYDGETYTLDGKEALSYVRARHDSEKDYGRGLRQQQVIETTMVKALSGDLSLDLVNSLLALVETDMAPALIYQYYDYFTNIGDVVRAIENNEKIDASSLNDTAWLSIFDYFGFDAKKVNADTIAEFCDYVISEQITIEEIKSYFFTSHQFYNETYSGHYNLVIEQLQEISDALRINLGLKPVEVSLPSAVYGDNEASGLTPMGWATSNGSTDDSQYYNTTNDQTDDVTTDVDTQPLDSDSDGVSDDQDVCAGYDDNIDTDADGIADGCDDTPDGITDLVCGENQEGSDTDGDGYIDSCNDIVIEVEAVCVPGEIAVDLTSSGIKESCQTDPNLVCEGIVVDTNGNGVEDTCQLEEVVSG